MLCAQATGVAVSGSYAYVTGQGSDSLVVVDISNPASPVIRGSVVSSSLLDEVREALSRVAQMASGAALASAPSMMLASAAPPAEALPLSLARCSHVHTGSGRCRERFVRLRGGAYIRFAGGGRH